MVFSINLEITKKNLNCLPKEVNLTIKNKLRQISIHRKLRLYYTTTQRELNTFSSTTNVP